MPAVRGLRMATSRVIRVGVLVALVLAMLAVSGVETAPSGALIRPAMAAAAWPSTSPWAWSDGVMQTFSDYSCPPGGYGTQMGAYTGYLVPKDGSGPNVGEVYYAHLFIGVPGNPCGGGYIFSSAIQLPPGTSPAAGASFPIRCWVRKPNQSSWTDVTAGGWNCPTSMPTSQRFDHSYDLVIGGLPSYSYMEIQFPVVSTTQLSGTTRFTAHVDYDSGPGTLDPTAIARTASSYFTSSGLRPTAVAGATPLVADYDGNGVSDILWYRAGSSSDPMWLGNGNGTFKAGWSVSVSGSYRPVSGDFTGDGRGDVLWFSASGADTLWRGRAGGGFTSGPNPAINGAYAPRAGDVNGDYLDDIVWYLPSGAERVWLGTSTGAFKESSHVPVVGSGATVMVDDFNGDGRYDVYGYSPTGADVLWLAAAGPSFVKGPAADAGAGLRPFSSEFTGDWNADIFWYGPGSATDRLWLGRNSGRFFSGTPSPVSGSYTPVPGGFGGSTLAWDVLWYDRTTGSTALWYGR